MQTPARAGTGRRFAVSVGALPGMRLTGRGRDQAAAAADLLRGWQAETIYASDAVRAQETAAIIAAALHLDVTVLPGLAEVRIGTREGAADPATWRCVAQVLQTWLVRGDLGPRVADGETGHEVTGRVSQALAGIAASHPPPDDQRDYAWPVSKRLIFPLVIVKAQRVRMSPQVLLRNAAIRNRPPPAADSTSM